MPVRGLLLLIFVLASIPVCFLRPMYGIMLWTGLAFLNPQSYTWIAQSFPWAEAVAIPTLGGILLFDRRIGRFASWMFFLFFLLWLWFTLTTLISTTSAEFVHHSVDTWDRWQFVTKVMLMSALIVPIVHSFERLRYLVLTIAGCFAFYVLKAFPFIVTTGGQFRIYGPEGTMIGDNNDFGLALNMTLPLFFFLAQTETKPWVKRFFGFLFVITIPAIFFTYSRGALVGLAAVFFVMILQSRRRFALLPVVLLAVAIGAFFAPEQWQERMNPNRDEALDASARSRLDSWAFARNLAADYPITGGGFATFTPELYDRFAPSKDVAVLGPHSVYFQLLAEHGYVGLGLYLMLVLSCVVTLLKLRRGAKANGDLQIAHYAHMFQFSLVAFLASGTFLGRAYFDYFFTIVICVTVLRQIAAERWAISPQVESAAPSALRAFPRSAA